MKLTKENIQFIDNYLIKNKVKYWDVRLELLDHIVSAVEDKMTNSSVSFNDALLEVHSGFGNQLIKGSISKDEVWTKGLYQSNIGFKKFIRNKQKQIGRKNRKQYWAVLKQLLGSLNFILEYVLFMGLLYMIYQYNPKTAFIIAIVALVAPDLYKFRYVFKSRVYNSLNANMAGLINCTFICTQGAFISFYKDEFTLSGIVDYSYIICFYALLYPLTRASLNLYRQILKTERERYNLMVA